MRGRMVAMLALAGCGTLGEPPAPSPFAACAVPVGGFADTSVLYQGLEVEFSGPVLASGTGEPADACFSRTSLGSAGASPDEADTWWIEVEDASGTPWVLAFWLPGGGTGPATGDVVSGQLSYLDGGFAPVVGALELRDQDDALIAWVGEGGELDELSPPDGIALAQGDAAGQDSDSCGTWAVYDLEASAGSDSAVIPYGEIGEIGALEVRHGGLDAQTSSSGCPDWFVARVSVAVLPLAR